MPQIVETPAGVIEFPDEFTPQQLEQETKKFLASSPDASRIQTPSANELMQKSQEQLRGAQQWDTLGKMIEPFTGKGMVNQPTRAINWVADLLRSKFRIPEYAGVKPEALGKNVPTDKLDPFAAITTGQTTGSPETRAIENVGAETLASATDPDNWPMMAAYAMSGPLAATAKAIVGAYMASQVPAAVKEGYQAVTQPGATRQSKEEAALRTLVQGAVAGASVVGAGAGPKAEPGPKADYRPSDFFPEVAQPSHQIEGPKGQFSVSPSGQVVDLSQLTEAEQRELLRGPREYKPRELKTYEGPPPIVGEQPPAKPQTQVDVAKAIQDAMTQRQIVPASQALGEPKQGGQVSFEGQAGGIPNARQQAQEPPPKFHSGVPFDVSDDYTKSLLEGLKLQPNKVGETSFFSGISRDPKTILESLKGVFQKRPEVIEGKWTPFFSHDDMVKDLHKGTAKKLETKLPSFHEPSTSSETTIGDRINSLSDEAKAAITETYNNLVKAKRAYAPVDVVLDFAEGGQAKFSGPLFRKIKWPLDFLWNSEKGLEERLTQPLAEGIKKNKLTKVNDERILTYLDARQLGTKLPSQRLGIAEERVKNIISHMSPGEMEYVRAWDKTRDSVFPTVQRIAKDSDNIDLSGIKDYSPLQRDWRRMRPEPDQLVGPRGEGKGKEPREASPEDAVDFLKSDFGQNVTPEKGFTIERLPNAITATKRSAFETHARHLKDVSHYVTSRPFLLEAAKVVRDPAFRDKYGDYTQGVVMDLLNYYAKQGRTTDSVIGRGMGAYRRMVLKGVLGFRPVTMLLHSANIPIGAGRIGPGWYKSGMESAITEEGQAFLHKHLKEVFTQAGGLEDVLGKQGRVTQAAFAPVRFLDQWNRSAVALGHYQHLLEESGKDPSAYASLPVNQEFLARARVEARRAVASPLYKDLPPILRSQLGKALFQFQNPFIDQWSNASYDLPRYLRDNPKKAMGLFLGLAAMTMMESGLKYGGQKGTEAVTGYHPKKDKEKSYADTIEHEALRRVPLAGQFTDVYDYGRSGIPMIDVAVDAVRSGKEMLQADTRKERKLAAIKAGATVAEMAGVPGAGTAGELVQKRYQAEAFKPVAEAVKERSQGKSLLERSAIEKEYRKEQGDKTEAERVRAGMAAVKATGARHETMMKAVPQETKKWLDSQQLRIPGYQDIVGKKGERVTLTQEEQDYFEKMLLEKHLDTIRTLRKSQPFLSLSGEARREDFSKSMSKDNKAATKEMVEILAKGGIKKEKKKTLKAFEE